MRVFAAVVAILCLFPASALGQPQPFVSTTFGFTADFPAPPVVGEPKGSETDANGHFISNLVTIKTEVPGVYTAMVSVETYTVPATVDSVSLQVMAKGFVAALNGTLKSSKSGKVDGFRARLFTYDSPDHSVAGNGVIVVVPAKKPRVYMVVNMHTPMASDEEAAELAKFVESFHLL